MARLGRRYCSSFTGEFVARIIGRVIQAMRRRGKYILCDLGNAEYFIVHLRMTGRLYIAENNASHDADRWLHFYLQLDNGNQLRFSDSRKFGRVYLIDDLELFTNKLGPEPLEDTFTVDLFRNRLRQRDRVIKALLLDQSFIAGIGNIYADEALYKAGIHPKKRSNHLSDEEIDRLYHAIRETLIQGIQHEGASISWYRKPDGAKGSSQNHFAVYGRTGEPCKRCGQPVEKDRVTQRGTHYCPNCQPMKSS